MKKLVTLYGGEIFAIPLFVSDIPSNKSFSRNKFEDKGKEFVFCRIIEDKEGGGFFAEIFDLVGSLDQNLESIITAKRLFRPLAISGIGIYKKRWKKLYTQVPYDKEKNSNASNIQLVLGTNDDLYLWENGKKTPVSEEEATKYEMWKIWMPSQLEKRIIEELFD